MKAQGRPLGKERQERTYAEALNFGWKRLTDVCVSGTKVTASPCSDRLTAGVYRR